MRPGLGSPIFSAARARASGHAVAFHKSLSGMLFFFDPNLGEYRFKPDDERKVFQELLLELWDGVYGQKDLAYDWVALVIFEPDAKSRLVAKTYDPVIQKVEEKGCLIM